MSCIKCNKPPQLPVTLDCNDVYCFLCLKEHTSNSNTDCCNQQCNQQINIDITNISKDFRTTLLAMIGKSVWLYSSLSNDGWWMYNPDTSNVIENCFGNQLPTCSFLIGAKTYRIQFDNSGNHTHTHTQTLISLATANNGNPKQRIVKRVTFTQSKIDQMNIKGIAGMYFKTIQDQIGKFV